MINIREGEKLKTKRKKNTEEKKTSGATTRPRDDIDQLKEWERHCWIDFGSS